MCNYIKKHLNKIQQWSNMYLIKVNGNEYKSIAEFQGPGSVGSDHYYTRYCLITGNRPWKGKGLFSFSINCLRPQSQ